MQPFWTADISKKGNAFKTKQSKKRPCILLFHRNLIWSKPIRQKTLCVSSQRDGRGAESLDVWFSLFISFIVPSCSRQQLQPSYIDLGPQTLTCALAPLPLPFRLLPSSSRTLEIIFLLTSDKVMDCIVLHVGPDLTICWDDRDSYSSSLGFLNDLG